MTDENNNINNFSDNASNDEGINEEEMKPIPEILDDEAFDFEEINKEGKKENEKETKNIDEDIKEINEEQNKNNDNKEYNNEEQIKKIEDKKDNNEDNNNEKKNRNIYVNDNAIEEEKVEYFPVDFLISEEEINSIDINIDSKNNIIDNEKTIPLKNNFFMTNLANKIKEKISTKKSLNDESKDNNIKNQKENKNEDKNKNQEEDEFEEMNEIEQISGLDDEDINNNLKENHQTSSERILGINTNLNKIESLKEDSNNNSFHSFSSSLNENIENKIEEIIDEENKENTFMKQMLVETNKHFIKEQRQQFEKLQEWGLKVIINILLNSKNRILQNVFYLIKYNRISFSKNRGKIIFKYYQKYREKIKNEFIKQYFLKFKIKSIEIRPREERILNLLDGLKIENLNVDILEKIEKLIQEKIANFKKAKKEEEEKIKKMKEEEEEKLKQIKNEEKNKNDKKNSKTNKKMHNIDNNIDESEIKDDLDLSIPPPPLTGLIPSSS